MNVVIQVVIFLFLLLLLFLQFLAWDAFLLRLTHGSGWERRRGACHRFPLQHQQLLWKLARERRQQRSGFHNRPPLPLRHPPVPPRTPPEKYPG